MKKISNIARNKLKRLDKETIIALNEMRIKMKYHQAFMEIVRMIIDEERDMLLSLNSADPNLAVKHANAKGRAGALTLFMHMLIGAGDEVERRDKE